MALTSVGITLQRLWLCLAIMVCLRKKGWGWFPSTSETTLKIPYGSEQGEWLGSWCPLPWVVLAKHPVFPGLWKFALSCISWFQVVVLAFQLVGLENIAPATAQGPQLCWRVLTWPRDALLASGQEQLQGGGCWAVLLDSSSQMKDLFSPLLPVDSWELGTAPSRRQLPHPSSCPFPGVVGIQWLHESGAQRPLPIWGQPWRAALAPDLHVGMAEAFIVSLSQPEPSLSSVLLHPSWGVAPVNAHLQGSFNTQHVNKDQYIDYMALF